MKLHPILLVLAFACFLFGAFAPPTRVNAVALGLALWIATLIV